VDASEDFTTMRFEAPLAAEVVEQVDQPLLDRPSVD
jgi:hypothetical protein